MGLSRHLHVTRAVTSMRAAVAGARTHVSATRSGRVVPPGCGGTYNFVRNDAAAAVWSASVPGVGRGRQKCAARFTAFALLAGAAGGRCTARAAPGSAAPAPESRTRNHYRLPPGGGRDRPDTPLMRR